VGLSGSGVIHYSIDNGYTWVRTAEMGYTYSWVNITFANGKFIAISGKDVCYSTDGINWYNCLTADNNEGFNHVSYGNGKYIIISTQKTYYSTDGITWQSAAYNLTYLFTDLVFGNGKFIIIAENYVKYSTDGIIWTNTSSIKCQKVTFGNGKFVVLYYGILNSDFGVAYSTDGITWTAASIPSLGFTTNDFFYQIVYGDGKFVIVGGAKLTYSTDGITWTQPVKKDFKLESMFYG
jgi:hypothetical protein